MTLKELSNITDIPTAKLKPVVRELAATIPSFSSKFHDGLLYTDAQYNIEEINAICDKFNLNELQKIYIRENYKEQPEKDIYEIDGTHAYLKNPDIKCCNTCKFLLGVTGKYKMPQPFCKVYNMYLKSFNAKVYEDYCTSYLKANLPKPRQWFKENAPINLNMYGETGTINGIDNSKMMNTERSVKGVITRVNQVGFDD